MSTPATAIIGFGMQLSFCTTSNGTYTSLVELVEIKPFGFKVGKAETIHHQSPNVGAEYAPGTLDYPEVEATVAWTKTEYPALNALARVKLYWKVQYPDGTSPTTGSTDIFPGFITEVQPATPMKERMTCQIKIQPTGLSVFTAGT